MALKRLLDLRPCDNCGGVLHGGVFHVVRVSLAFVKADAVNQFAGMHRFFGGRASPALVENFAPASVDAIVIAGDKEPELMTELVICHDCISEKLDLALLAERVHTRQKRDAETKDRT